MTTKEKRKRRARRKNRVDESKAWFEALEVKRKQEQEAREKKEE